jgi:hypothetical protein
MSPLDAYITARDEVTLAALEMLAAERRLADFDIHIAGVLVAEADLDKASAALTAAVDALPQDSGRIPVGWDQPATPPGAAMVARADVAKAVLRCLYDVTFQPESSYADAEAEYAEELLCLAARNLAADLATMKRAS